MGKYLALDVRTQINRVYDVGAFRYGVVPVRVYDYVQRLVQSTTTACT